MEYRAGSPNDTFIPDVPSDRAAAFESELSRKKRTAATIVPTNDGQVRTRLRELKEPITLFGEGAPERRDRLRGLLTDLRERAEVQAAQDADGDTPLVDAIEDGIGADDDKDDEQEEFYTEGSEALLRARHEMARYSLRRAQAKMNYQKLEHSIPLRAHLKRRKEIKERLSGVDLFGSQIAAERPVSIVRFAPDGETLAAGNWGGSIALLDVPNLNERRRWKGHADRVGGLCWYPGATLPARAVSPDSVNLASGGGEGDVQLWSLTADTPLATLSGHTGRVGRVDFHPSGSYLASASFDTTWRLWDVATTTELLLQEGHSREVFTVAFNADGSLAASAGLDSIGRVWDLRTGRTIMLLEGHTREIYATSWAPDSYRLLTGSADGLAIVWDVRMVRETARVPAHTRGVTDLRWFNGTDGPADAARPPADDEGNVLPKTAGTFFVSCGFDQHVNVFSADDWAPCKTLTGHSGNVLSADVTTDARWIASGGYDRTVKLWARDDGLGL